MTVSVKEHFPGELVMLQQFAVHARQLSEEESGHRRALSARLLEVADKIDGVVDSMSASWARGSVFPDVVSTRVHTYSDVIMPPGWDDDTYLGRKAEEAMRFTADRAGVPLYGSHDWQMLALAAVRGVATAGAIVSFADHVKSIEEERAKTRRWMRSFFTLQDQLDAIHTQAGRQP